MNSVSCPISINDSDVVMLSHGSGGKDSSRLLEQIFLPAFSNAYVQELHDGATLELAQGKIAYTTDSYVIQPLFFPGGDIGSLAVTGTMNDLAMCGAKPAFLSCGFILEEGFLLSDLRRIVESMQKTAVAHNVQIVTGDTKVIERTTGKNIFINTSGIGYCLPRASIHARHIQPGDAILLSGDVGRHGMAIMAARERLSFQEALLSDCAPLFPLVQALFSAGICVHCLRDLTRGGLATALVELAEAAEREFILDEESIAVSTPVRSVCELLGFDPLYVANEGRFVAFIPQDQVQEALSVLRSFSDGALAMCIGNVGHAQNTCVRVKNSFGSHRLLYKLVGEQLPRIC